MSFKNRLVATSHSYATIPLRLGVGAIMVGHGAQKLFGWFDGYGLTKAGEAFASMGMEPGVLMAALAGGTEFFGGILLILGLFTRVAALALAGTMAVAIAVAHSTAFFLPTGMEFALILLLASLSLLISGGGAWSLDRRV